jgi:hypothetical protein
MRYSDLTPEDIAGLRILAALEQAYPDKPCPPGKLQASVVLKGWKAWKAGRKPTPHATEPRGAT